MNRRVAIVVLWVAALGAMGVVYWGQRADEVAARPPTSSHGDDGIPLRMPSRDKAAAGSRRPLPVSEAPAGSHMYRGHGRHTARFLHQGPAQPRLRWSFRTRGRITAQPTVGLDGTIYVGSHDHRLYAISRAGTLVWDRDLQGPVYSTVLLDDAGNVYVGSDARVFWSFTSGGRLRWQVRTVGDADTAAVLGPDGQVFFGAGNSLYCVGRDGSARWRFEVGGKIYSSPAVDTDGTLYFGAQDDQLYAVDAEGRLRWSYRTRGDNDSSPVIGDDGTIYFGSDDGRVYALDRDGALRWSRDLGGYVRAPVAMGEEGSVVAAVFGPRPAVVGLDGRSGVVRWAFTITVTNSLDAGVASGPIVDRDGNVFFGAYDNYFYSVSPTGTLRWVFEAQDDIDSAPMLTPDGWLLFGSDDHLVYALGGPPPTADPPASDRDDEGANGGAHHVP